MRFFPISKGEGHLAEFPCQNRVMSNISPMRIVMKTRQGKLWSFTKFSFVLIPVLPSEPLFRSRVINYKERITQPFNDDVLNLFQCLQDAVLWRNNDRPLRDQLRREILYQLWHIFGQWEAGNKRRLLNLCIRTHSKYPSTNRPPCSNSSHNYFNKKIHKCMVSFFLVALSSVAYSEN